MGNLLGCLLPSMMETTELAGLERTLRTLKKRPANLMLSLTMDVQPCLELLETWWASASPDRPCMNNTQQDTSHHSVMDRVYSKSRVKQIIVLTMLWRRANARYLGSSFG